MGQTDQRRRQPQPAAALSMKQIARTVVDGREVTFEFDHRADITGYVCGVDSYHWMVVHFDKNDDAWVTRLVHKSKATTVKLHSKPSLDALPVEVEAVVAPFRKWCNENFFGRTVEAVA